MIVDFHTHIFPPAFVGDRGLLFSGEPAFELLYGSPDSRMAGTEELLRTMDEEEIERSVVFGFPWEKEDHLRRHNDYVIESVQKYPHRLTGFCTFSPLSNRALKEAERCLDAGLSGVGELALYHGDASAVPRGGPLRELADLCLRFDVPVLLHANEPVGHAYPGKTTTPLSEFYELVKERPANRFVLAHWGGGLFFYALMKKEVREVLRNTWFDTAASPYLYTPDIYRIAGEIIGYERILFGSDYPLLKPGRYFQEMEDARIPEEAVKKIKGENAALLLGLT
ncbi:MAG: amidohydrolase [Deltaproteobacteria bacterium]|nr:amidohydrolase [Deltaproteobacteria bacterium]